MRLRGPLLPQAVLCPRALLCTAHSCLLSRSRDVKSILKTVVAREAGLLQLRRHKDTITVWFLCIFPSLGSTLLVGQS